MALQEQAMYDPEMDVCELLPDFLLHVKAKRRSPRTLELYRRHVTRFADWLAADDRPADVRLVTTRTLEAFTVDLAGHVGPSTVAMHYRSLRAFWSWLETEGEIETNPFRRIDIVLWMRAGGYKSSPLDPPPA